MRSDIKKCFLDEIQLRTVNIEELEQKIRDAETKIQREQAYITALTNYVKYPGPIHILNRVGG